MKNTRPQKLSEFIGKEEIKAMYRVYLNQAKTGKGALTHTGKRIFEHTLMYGLPGVGKTSLALITANELGKKIWIIQGSSIQKNIDLINLALSTNKDTLLFIDGIQDMHKDCIPLLAEIMSKNRLAICLGEDFDTQITKISLDKFTVIAAAPLGVDNSLEDLFGIVINLKPYDKEELAKITKRAFKIYDDSLSRVGMNGCTISEKAVQLIVENSKGIPLNVVRLVKKIDWVLPVDRKEIEERDIKELLKKLGISQDGLDIDDRHCLHILESTNKPTKIAQIAKQISVNKEDVVTRVMPYLQRQGYVEETLAGIKITDKGVRYLKQNTKTNDLATTSNVKQKNKVMRM